MLKQGRLHATPCARPFYNAFSSKETPIFLLHVNRPSYPLQSARKTGHRCEITRARRRVIYEDEDEEDEKSYGQNTEIAILESYSESKADEVLLVRTWVDDHEEEVLIFKGFSSCLSGRTSADPSKSVLPARAVIKSIDRIKGPFDPANVEYLEKGLSWEGFKGRLGPPK